MRKLALLALAPLLSACHSSHSDIEPQSEVEYIKTISVSLPEGFDTRAFSDGQTATYLTYAVYRVSDGELTLTESSLREKSLTNKRATVEVSMISGQAYKVIFWADAGEACPYTIDLSAGTVTMDYSDDNTRIEANNEARDAFYALLNVESADLSTTDTVRLRRPLAQLNVGSQSVGETVQGVSVCDIEFSVTVPAGLPTVFCLMDSTATNPTTQPIVFSATGLPSGETYPVCGYDYLLMNYMLCGATALHQRLSPASQSSSARNTPTSPTPSIRRSATCPCAVTTARTSTDSYSRRRRASPWCSNPLPRATIRLRPTKKRAAA